MFQLTAASAPKSNIGSQAHMILLEGSPGKSSCQSSARYFKPLGALLSGSPRSQHRAILSTFKPPKFWPSSQYFLN